MKKTVLITGARAGIGRDVALALAKRGHRVIATVHREESVLELEKFVAEHGVTFEVSKLDITFPEDRTKLIGRSVDVLINNAAIGESGSLAEVPLGRLRANFETNVFATLAVAQVALTEMVPRRAGRVIFVSSLGAHIPMPFWGPYCTTKAALSSGVRILRKELSLLGSGVFVTLIEPGTYATGFNQKVMSRKWEWMDERSYFWNLREMIRHSEKRSFAWLERKNNRSIVKKIVKAVEAGRPKVRYTAPWWQVMYAWFCR